jgi:aspartyl-tRNA(Asn)/glutamyl-tRNA(Gln) amidotransferase subunit A
VAARLGAEGVEIVPCRPFPWQEAAAAAAVVIAAEALEIHRSRLGERWPGYSRALRARVLAGAGLSGADYVRALRLREELRATWRRLLRADAVDAVLGPTLPHTAPVEGEAAAVPVDPDVHVVPLSVHALLGIPAISVPVALDREGLPIGVQVAAAEGDDGLVLDVAGRIESGRERWRVPPMAVDPLARTRSAGGQPPSRRDA